MVGSPKAADELRKTFDSKYIDAKGNQSSSVCGQAPQEAFLFGGHSSLPALHWPVVHDWQIPAQDEASEKAQKGP